MFIMKYMYMEKKGMHLTNTASGLCIETVNLFIFNALLVSPKISYKSTNLF